MTQLKVLNRIAISMLILSMLSACGNVTLTDEMSVSQGNELASANEEIKDTVKGIKIQQDVFG